MNRAKVIAVDERLEKLLNVFCSEEPAVPCVIAPRGMIKIILLTLWYSSYVRVRDMVFDHYAVRDILYKNILPEHVRNVFERYSFRDLLHREFAAQALLEEIICGSAVMSIAGDYYGHAWSAEKERHSSSEVNLYRKTEKLFSDTQRTVHA